MELLKRILDKYGVQGRGGVRRQDKFATLSVKESGRDYMRSPST